MSFGLWLQKQGYRNSTVQPSVEALKALAKRINLLGPESVKEHLALAQLGEGRKQKEYSEEKVKEFIEARAEELESRAAPKDSRC